MNSIQKYLIFYWFKQYFNLDKRLIDLQLERIQYFISYKIKKQLIDLSKKIKMSEEDQQDKYYLIALFFCENYPFNNGSIYFLIQDKINWQDLYDNTDKYLNKLNKYLKEFNIEEIKLSENLKSRIKKGAGNSDPFLY